MLTYLGIGSSSSIQHVLDGNGPNLSSSAAHLPPAAAAPPWASRRVGGVHGGDAREGERWCRSAGESAQAGLVALQHLQQQRGILWDPPAEEAIEGQETWRASLCNRCARFPVSPVLLVLRCSCSPGAPDLLFQA